MRNKKLFSFDELRDAEIIYNGGFLNGKIDYSQMYLIAKYMREVLGYGQVRLERELIAFCKNQNKNFNPVLEAGSIKKWIKVAMKYKLRKVDSIVITKKESEFLKSIEPIKDRKILFVTLVLAKALSQGREQSDGNYYIWYSNFQDVINLSKFTNVTETSLADIYHKYKQYFTFYNAEKELIKLLYTDNDIEGGDVIEDMNDIMGYYDSIFTLKKKPPVRIQNCIICEIELEKTGRSQKMCPTCAENKIRENQKLLMRKRRNALAISKGNG